MRWPAQLPTSGEDHQALPGRRSRMSSSSAMTSAAGEVASGPEHEHFGALRQGARLRPDVSAPRDREPATRLLRPHSSPTASRRRSGRPAVRALAES